MVLALEGGDPEAGRLCVPVSPPHLALLKRVQPELQRGHQLAVEGALQAVVATVHQGTLLLSTAGRARQAGRRHGAGAGQHFVSLVWPRL